MKNYTATEVIRNTERYWRRAGLDIALRGTYSDRFMWACHRALRKHNVELFTYGSATYDQNKLTARVVRWADRLERLVVLRKAD
jgi:hypothetical protein